MNVAIFGVHPSAQIVANVIESYYNPWLRERGGETLNITAFVIGEGGVSPLILVG